MSPHISPCTIGALIHDFERFTPERAAAEYPWATRFVMGLPLPPWQREFKWDLDQVRRFIQSVWTGVHLGTYVITDMELRPAGDGFNAVEYLPLSNCVIDGQQRLMALELFLTDQVEVPDGSGALCRWTDIHPTDQRRFRNVVFSRGMLRDLDENGLRSVYNTMNFGGVAHEEHERAVIHQDLDDPDGTASLMRGG
ncbi:MAG: DUF262 domain-containing protein [Variovorax sp.]